MLRLFGTTVTLLATATLLAAQAPVAPRDCMPGTPSAEKAEAECLASLKGIAERKGDDLHLKLKNGQFKILKNITSGCPPAAFDRMKCLHLRLIAHHARSGAFLVDVSYHEGGRVLLVSGTTGAETELSAAPHYSPGGKRLVVVDATELGDRPHDIMILSAESDPPRVEWQYSTPKGQPYEAWEFVAWNGDDRIRLRAEVHKGGGVTRRDTEAIRTSAGWQLKRPWARR